MKNKLLTILLCLSPWFVTAQQQTYSTYYYQRASLFDALPITSNDIVFLGNSITDGGEWAELLDNKALKNRGISGDIAQGVYDRLPSITNGKPAKIFLLIGINDLSRGTPADSIVHGVSQIVNQIRLETPHTKLYLQSVLPVNDCYGMFKGHTSRWKEVAKINTGLETLARETKITYIDIYSPFIGDEPGKMDRTYTNDGLHLMGTGYLKWVEIITPFVKE